MNCTICDKIRERQAIILYEDDSIVAILPSKPSVLGHIRLLPKNHYIKLDQIPESSIDSLLGFSSFASTVVFELLRAQGTNILLNENENHLFIDVIPRNEKDGLNFNWKPKQSAPEDLDSIFAKVKDKAFVIGKNKEKSKVNSESNNSTVNLSITSPDKKSEESLTEVKIVDKDNSKNKSISDINSDSLSENKKKPESYLIKQLRKIP